MWRIAVVVFIAVAAGDAGRAELCGVDIETFERPEQVVPCGRRSYVSDDFLFHWRSAWLDSPEDRAAKSLACTLSMSGDSEGTGCAVAIDSAGEELDRWWYAYLDRQRYRFFDASQYNLLGGPCDCGWGWCRGVWPDVFWLPVPVRSVREKVQPIPEPATAAFLAFGAVVLLRMRRSVNAR